LQLPRILLSSLLLEDLMEMKGHKRRSSCNLHENFSEASSLGISWKREVKRGGRLATFTDSSIEMRVH